MHLLTAMLAGVEEAVIDEGEAQNFAEAILGVLKQRKVKPNPEGLAWGNFASVAFTLYGPRLIAFLARRRAERKEKASAAQPKGTEETATTEDTELARLSAAAMKPN